MSQILERLLLPPLARRRPETAGLEGWAAQLGLMTGLPVERATAAALAAERPARAGEAARVAVQRAARGELGLDLAVPLALLLDDGLMELPEGAERAELTRALIRATAAEGSALRVAVADEAALDAWVDAHAATLEGAGLSWTRSPERMLIDPVPRVCIAQAEELAIVWLRERRMGRRAPARLRLLLDAADDTLLGSSRREVLLHEDRREPELNARTADAFELARGLVADEHFRIDGAEVALTDAGRSVAEELARRLDRWWLGPRRREALLRHALLAQRVLVEGEHYRMTERGPELVPAAMAALDETLQGTVFGVSLLQLLRIRHRIGPAPRRVVIASCELQRYVRSAPRLCGFLLPGSGARDELRRLYGLPVAGAARVLSPVHSVDLASPLAPDEDAARALLPAAACVITEDEGRVEVEGAVPAGQPAYLLGGPVQPRRRRQLRAALTRQLGTRVADLLWSEHPAAALGLRSLPAPLAALCRRAPRALQSALLRHGLAAAESLETESRVAMYRRAELTDQHSAFLGGTP